MIKFFIVVPCYNEEKRLDLNHFYQFSQQNKEYKILFVDDGSNDNTLDILKKLSFNSENIRYISYKKNRGKSYAVRTGVLNILDNNMVENTYIGFLDADLSISTEDIDKLYKTAILNPKLGFIYYMKNKKQYYSKKYVRYLISNILKIMNNKLYNINIDDTQCGCKIFKSKVAEIIFREEFNSKWLFDLEIFLRLIENYTKTYLDDFTCGISNKRIKYAEKSKIKTTIFLQVILDYITIYRRYNRLFDTIPKSV